MSDPLNNNLPVFVGTYTDERTEGIHILRMDSSTGALEAVSKVDDVRNPFFFATDSNANTLYAGCCVDEFQGEQGGSVKSFSIDASGNLTQTSEQAAKGATPCYVSVDATDACLLVANYSSGNVAAFSISDGKLGPATQVVQHEGSSVDTGRQEGPHVHSIVLSPDSRFAFAADLGTDEVRIYRLDPENATLTPNDPPYVSTKPGAGPRHLAFNPAGNRAYLLNELDSTIVVYDYDDDAGSLTARQTLSALPAGYKGENFCADIRVHPSGRLVYASNRGHDSIAVLAVDSSTGELTSLGHPSSGGAWPWNLEFDPSGTYLLSANQRSNNVVGFRIDPADGSLEQVGSVDGVPGAVCVKVLGA
ncbi:MAG: hypothetical protein CME25_19620 [Gemmatimonadetes bacterium]|nr:hypothetical protein [Gemmatimonadota bacterium]|tara:strand:- start:268 stop:1353 length:1086 start_codon:yes stop_codon:yes gene_type:complete